MPVAAGRELGHEVQGLVPQLDAVKAELGLVPAVEDVGVRSAVRQHQAQLVDAALQNAEAALRRGLVSIVAVDVEHELGLVASQPEELGDVLDQEWRLLLLLLRPRAGAVLLALIALLPLRVGRRRRCCSGAAPIATAGAAVAAARGLLLAARLLLLGLLLLGLLLGVGLGLLLLGRRHGHHGLHRAIPLAVLIGLTTSSGLLLLLVLLTAALGLVAAGAGAAAGAALARGARHRPTAPWPLRPPSTAATAAPPPHPTPPGRARARATAGARGWGCSILRGLRSLAAFPHVLR